jgi:hypothetical protein
VAITRTGTGSGKVTVAGATTLVITITTTANRHLVIAGSTAQQLLSSVADSGSGSWTIKIKTSTIGAGAGNHGSYVAYSENRGSITSATLTFAGAAYSHAALDQWDGVATSSSFDVQTDAEGAVSTDTWGSGNLTAGGNNYLIYGAASGDDSGANPWNAPGGAWTEIFQDGDTSVNTATNTVFQIASGSSGPFSATFDYTGMDGGGYAGCSCLVSFKSASAGAPVFATLGQFDPELRIKAWF